MDDQPDASWRPNAPPDPNARPVENPGSGEHRPFRTWALQQDVFALIGPESNWSTTRDELGIDPPPERTADEVRGQRYLNESLQPGQRYTLRIRTAIVLWTAVILTDCLNQLGPVSSRLSSETFRLSVITEISMVIFLATIYPRLKPFAFAVAEQSMLIVAYSMTLYQASITGGSESPYLVSAVYPIFYAAYLIPGRRAIANITVVVTLMLLTIFMDQSNGGAYSYLVILTLAIVSAMLAGTLRHQRRLEMTVARATKFLALADPLTGVANQRSFDRFSSEIEERGGDRFALAMVDMNGLKGANAVFGFDVGDGMILRMAKLLLSASNPRSQVFRIGGDEFVVLMPGGARELAEWQKRFDSLVVEHNTRVRGRLPQISASIGTSISPTDSTDLNELVDIADKRMFEQKSPAVQPPHELDSAVSSGAGASLRLTRFTDVPRRAIEPNDVLAQSALDWLVVSSLTLMTLSIGDQLIAPRAVVAVGTLGLLNMALSLICIRTGSRKPLLAILDVSAILYGGLAILATGESDSPIQVAMLLPVAFYAQFLRGRDAFVRVALICVVYSVTFWAPGDVANGGITLYVSILSAMLMLTAVLQYSSGTIARSLDTVRQSATLDPLTHAANVHALREDLASAIDLANSPDRGICRPALVLADLDRFKRFNVSSGHLGGDRVLIAAVDRLESEFAAEVKVYRVGGDEFALLFTVDSGAEAGEIASHCRRALDFTQRTSSRSEMHVSASVGLAVWSDSMSTEDLVESAAAALAEDKAENDPEHPDAPNIFL